MKLDTKEFEAKMKKSIDAYINELDTVRAGRANPNILSKVTVDYYGSATPVNQVGTVSVPDARTIVIQPWDSSLLKAIEKARSRWKSNVNFELTMELLFMEMKLLCNYKGTE